MEALNMLIGTEEALAGAKVSGNYITLNQDTGDMDLCLNGEKAIGINKDRLEGKQDKIGEVTTGDNGPTLRLNNDVRRIENSSLELAASQHSLVLSSTNSDIILNTKEVHCTGARLKHIGEPTGNDDAVPKQYVYNHFATKDEVNNKTQVQFYIWEDEDDD